MADYDPEGKFKEPSMYKAIAASQTTSQLGGVDSYIETITVLPASSTPGAWSLLDGSTTIGTFIAGAGGDTKPYTVHLGIRSASTVGFKVTTGASVSVIVTGRF